MKKWILWIICLLLSGCGATTKETAKQKETKEPSYCSDESDSGTCGIGSMDMSDYAGFHDENNVFVKSDMQEAIEIFRKKQSAILYFGFPDCPWCIEALPIMDESAKAHQKKIYYIQTRDAQKQLLYTKEQKEELIPYLTEFLSTDDQGEKQLYVPLVVVVKKGKAMSANTGTVTGHDAHERQMKDEEKVQLRAIYDKMFS